MLNPNGASGAAATPEDADINANRAYGLSYSLVLALRTERRF